MAQNPIVHLNNTDNSSLDYITSNRYVLSGNSYPSSISGYSNTYPSSTTIIPRIKLRILNNGLNTILNKTYCTQDEINNYDDCGSLTVMFFATDAKQTADGGFIICGQVRNDEFSSCPTSTYVDVFLLKTDATGTVQWYKRYDTDIYWLYSVVEDAATGNFLTCGYSSVGSFVMGTDANGTPLWAYNTLTPQYHTGSILGSQYKEITPYSSGGNQYYVLTGTSGVEFTGGVNYGGALLTVVDANGSIYQNVTLTEDPIGRFLHCYGVNDAHDDDVILTGFSGGNTCSATDGYNLVLIKLNPLTLATNFMNTYSANPQNTFDVSRGFSVVRHPNSDQIYVTGTRYDGSNYYGVYLETDLTGNPIRYVPHVYTDATQGNAIVYNYQNNYPVYSGNVHFSVNSASTSFIIKNSYGYDCTADENIYLDYPYFDTIKNIIDTPIVVEISEQLLDFDIDWEQEHICGDLEDGNQFLLSKKNTQLAEIRKGFIISPNPTNDIIRISFTNGDENNKATVRVFDPVGRNMCSSIIVGQSGELSMKQYPKGIYFIEIKKATQTFIEKIIIE